MLSITTQLNILNQEIYRDLYSILRKLNKRFHLKFYTVLCNKQSACVDTIRVKKTVSGKEKGDYGVISESIQKFDNLFTELLLVNPFDQNMTQFQTEIAGKLNNNIIQTIKLAERVEAVEQREDDVTSQTFSTSNSKGNSAYDSRVLYANQFEIEYNGSNYKAMYVLEIRNLDEETIRIFYANPEFSYLRMVLDYFFSDYYRLEADERITLNQSPSLDTRYHEDCTQFARRMARLFLGKMHNFLQKDRKNNEQPVFMNERNPIYYVNDLLEKIDDISTQTYEGISPFGSMLFCNRHSITEKNQQRIKFTIKFLEDDLIKLDDAKRIRKLLELTDEKQDMYLIADHQYVYGLGEVDWGQMGDNLALRLDFKGLSKYRLQLVHVDKKLWEQGKMIMHKDEKIYLASYRLISETLLTISFKNPKLGEEGFTVEKLSSLLQSQFFENSEDEEFSQSKIKVLVQIIQKAREQKHGTMVVITKFETAKAELKILKKQSTLIEPSEINLDSIKYLTSIDGAIYFDQEGACHGIGVILDGVAKEDIGDASRGARFNSAHRYLAKIKENYEGDLASCVIAIISEDGMVNLIPELDNEDQIFGLVQEIIDNMNEQDEDVQAKIAEKEQELSQFPHVDYDWFYSIAQAFFKKEEYSKALEYCQKGKKAAGTHHFIPSHYYNLQGDCYYFLDDDEESYKAAIPCYETALTLTDNPYIQNLYRSNIAYTSRALARFYRKEKSEHFTTFLHRTISEVNSIQEIAQQNNLAINAGDYNIRALSYADLGKRENDANKQKEYFMKALDDYTTAIDCKESNIYYWNRTYVYSSLSMHQEAVKDLIHAELIHSSEKYLKSIKDILDKHPEIKTNTLTYYRDMVEKVEPSQELKLLMEEYEAQINERNLPDQEVAASKQEKES